MSAFVEELRQWLDTETRAILCPVPPTKLTEIGAKSFSLFLLGEGKDKRRMQDVMAAIREQSPVEATDHPGVVGRRMSLEEALVGQFALACCDCVTAFVRDEAADEMDQNHLRWLREQVLASAEFEPVSVILLYIPHTEIARRFCWQFLGLATGIHVPTTCSVFRKKARLMVHWARKAGIDLRVADAGQESGG